VSAGRGVDALFRAELLPLLWPWLPEPFMTPFTGIQVEPGPDGGVDLVATDNRGLLWVHDADGHASASFAFQPKRRMVKACRPPAVRLVDENGEHVEPRLPDWAIPGRAHIIETLVSKAPRSALALIDSKDHTQGLGFYNGEVEILAPPDRPMVQFRMLLDGHNAEPTDQVALSTEILARFSKLALVRDGCCLRFSGSLGAVVMEFADGHGISMRAIAMPMVQEARP
jgi:hypothetical protein